MRGAFRRAVLCAILLSVAPDLAIGALGQDKVKWEYSLEPAVARPGEAVAVKLTASIEEDWYMYSHELKAEGPTPLQIRFELPEGLATIGGIEAPKPEIKFDEGFTTNVEIYHNTVTFAQKILIPENAAVTSAPIRGSVRFQTCTGSTCLPPTTRKFELALAIEAGPIRDAFRPPAALIAAAPDASVSKFAGARDTGLLAFLIVALVQGFLALLTPCVYPMIPITISFFLKQGEQSGRKPFVLASIYAISIIVTFTAVGLILALAIGGAGAQQLGASPVANAFLAALFFAFALSLFGAFEIQAPAGMQNWLSQRGRSGGYVGTAFLGLAFTLASLACTAPFIGSLLGLAATGSRMRPLVGMVAFSATFSLPFFFLALFPQYLARMPKSGGWLNAVKVVMGFIVLAVALKFLGNVDAVREWGIFTRQLVLAAWAVIAFFCAAYLLGMIRLPHDSAIENVGTVRLLFSIAFLTFGLYLAAGLFGAPIYGTLDAFLPADKSSPAHAGSGSALNWVENYEAALVRAKAEQRPIFIDFTGVTCTNCKWMDKNMLARPDVSEALKRFVLAKLWTDVGEDAERNQEMQVKRFGTAALPLYAIVSPQDTVLARFEGLTRNPEEFLKFLRAGLAGGNT